MAGRPLKQGEDNRYSKGKLYSIRDKVTTLYNGAVTRAKEKQSEMTLTREWIAEKLFKGTCDLTNLPFAFHREAGESRNAYAPSIDKINKRLGYTEDNCRIVLWAVNCAMSEYGDEIMLPIFIQLGKYAEQRELAPIPTEHFGEGEEESESGFIHGAWSGEDCDGSHHSRGESEGENPCDSSEEGCRICMGSRDKQLEALKAYESREDYGLTDAEAESLARIFRCICYKPRKRGVVNRQLALPGF